MGHCLGWFRLELGKRRLVKPVLETGENAGGSESVVALLLPFAVHDGMGRRPHSPACLRIVKDRNVLGPAGGGLGGLA